DASGTRISLPPDAIQGAAAATTLEVILPSEDAQVWVDGRITTSTGARRSFASPPLQPGKIFTYTITAAWNQDGKIVVEERKVEVSAGTIRRGKFMQTHAATGAGTGGENLERERGVGG